MGPFVISFLTFTLVMIMFCAGCLVGGLLTQKLSPKLYIWISGVLFLLGFLLSSFTQSLVLLYLGK